MTLEKECDKCGKKVRIKHLKRINKNYVCKHCSVEIRRNHRKETIENSGDKEIIKELDKELRKEDNRKQHEKRKQKRILRIKDSTPPKPKGSKTTIVNKNNCYISMQEKQNLFRILLNRGVDGDAAKERIKNLVRSQKELRERMLNQKKSEKEIKIEQNKLLEELWNY